LRQIRARLRPLACTGNIAPAIIALMRMRLSTPTGSGPVCRKASHARMSQDEIVARDLGGN